MKHAVRRLCVLLASVGSAVSIHAQRALILEPAEDPQTWVVEHGSVAQLQPSGEPDVLAITARAGWVHTERATFGNFRLRFEAQARPAPTRALFAFFGEGPASAASVAAYAFPLNGAVAPSAKQIGKKRLKFFPPDPAVVAGAIGQRGGWQAYEIARIGSVLSATLNGREILHGTVPKTQDGWIGFLTDEGTLALRNIQLTASMSSPVPPATTVLRPGGDVTSPRLLSQPTPEYTRAAVQARVKGTVRVECIVRPTGECTDIEVVRSLDPVFGLDDEAIKAARLWRFEPGTRRGQPVPVLVVIEVEFDLR